MNDRTTLLRQIHPTFYYDGRVTSQAFNPSREHDYRLSVYDGDQVSAEESWHHYTQESAKPSIGVYGVSVAECKELGLPVEPDPEAFAAHALIDFRGLSTRKQRDLAARQLRNAATDRGWLYQPS